MNRFLLSATRRRRKKKLPVCQESQHDFSLIGPLLDQGLLLYFSTLYLLSTPYKLWISYIHPLCIDLDIKLCPLGDGWLLAGRLVTVMADYGYRILIIF
jgi:hypothetical protein